MIARAQRGDEAAFQALFEAHKFRVYSLCLRMTGNSADAEDLTQETFLRVFRRISTFRGASAFSTWLHRLTINEVLIFLRKKRLPVVPLVEVDNSHDDPVALEYPDVDRRLMGTLGRIDLNHAIAGLPQVLQSAVVLFEMEGYKHQEIARMMNCSVGSSKSNLHRARGKLRHSLRSLRAEVSPAHRMQTCFNALQ
jgi:RNA polymerase sigma-70 factor (ECF subfamily)